ncbi:MAG TPA: YihY/virulence factor BrkB family protein [Bryobacteraceae bacterium]|nr:YihY/virulence factor BrkB family protein [Bryobacteraceae bacterium]
MRWPEWAERFRPTLRYWMETEVHVYAFAVAACVLLSFFPFLIVILAFCRHVLNWRAAADALNLALSDYFPGALGEFIQRNLWVTVADRGELPVVSLLLLLFVANGIFEPLEVAFNRAWGVPKHRSFLRNQLVSFALILVCGTLALASTTFAALNQEIWRKLLGPSSWLLTAVGLAAFKLAAIPVSILILLLVYWLLPNRRIRARDVVPAAVVVGLALEILKYVNLLTWPLLRVKLSREYGPFVYSASILLWSFFAAMIVLAGAEWSARKARAREQAAGGSVPDFPDAQLQLHPEADRLEEKFTSQPYSEVLGDGQRQQSHAS